MKNFGESISRRVDQYATRLTATLSANCPVTCKTYFSIFQFI